MDRSLVAAACLVAACGRLGFDDRSTPPSHDAPIVIDSRVADTASHDGPPLDAHVPIPPKFVQHAADSNDNVTVVTSAFANQVTAGNTLIIGIDYGEPAGGTNQVIDSVVDDVGTTFTLAGPYDGRVGDETRCYIAYGLVPSTGGDAVTVTLDTPSNRFFEVRMHEYADVSATAPLDNAVGSSNGSSGSDASVTPITTTEDNELIFAMVVDSTVSSGTGYTGVGSDFGDLTEDRIAPTPATYDVLASPTDIWVSFVGAFRGR